MYAQDYADAMLVTEQSVRDYNKDGDRNVFDNYFSLVAGLESAEFCSIVDTLQIGQSDGKALCGI